ncbi:hypothetical protein ACJRO0_10180 [Acetobacter oryzifermentans]|uniref:hypothetical protein n=1 Tax=Acetobacter oryzifermentans TaxID=1633874 RepID=UPI0039BF0063
MTDKRQMALQELHDAYEKIRTVILEADEDADFAFMSGLAIINHKKDGFDFVNAYFGNPDFLYWVAPILFGDTLTRLPPKDKRPEEVMPIINNCLQMGREKGTDISGNTAPCSTTKH